MRQRHHLLFPLLFFLLTACGHEKKVLPDDIPYLADTQTVSAVPQSGKTFKGLFVVGKNFLSFRECNHPEKDLAVIDSTGKMKELYKSIFLHSPAFPNEYVYVEVKGKISAATTDESAHGFDSAIIVKDVLTVEQKSYQNSCIPYDFWCLGKDWSLQISAKEGVMVLKDFAAMKVYVFEYFAPKNQNDEVFTYASNNYAAGAAIKAVITKSTCTEEATSSSFQYSATAIINGKFFRGCAIQGVGAQ